MKSALYFAYDFRDDLNGANIEGSFYLLPGRAIAALQREARFTIWNI
jgi:hypothetical protein